MGVTKINEPEIYELGKIGAEEISYVKNRKKIDSK